jgi:hypothetical protein
MMEPHRHRKKPAAERLELRCTRAEKKEWLAAAGHDRRSLSDWARLSLSNAAAQSKGEKS